MPALNNKKLTFALLCLANLAISFNFAALAAVVPAMARELGVADVSAARLLHYYMIPYGLGALIYAPLSYRWTFRNILAGSLIVYAAANLLCGVSGNLTVILLARIAMGIAAASVIPLALIVIGKYFDRETRGRFVGLFFSSSFVASLAGLFLSGVASWRWLFFVPAALGIGAALLMMLFGARRLGHRQQGAVDYAAVLADSRIRDIFIFIFVISFLYHGVHKWFGVYLDHVYGLKQLAISSYFMLIAVFGAVGQNIGGWLTDKQGRYASTRLGVLILALCTMLLLGKFPHWVLAILFAGFSVGWTIGHNGVSTVLTDLPDEHRSEIAALNSAVRFFSGGLGFFAGGSFVEKNFGLTFFGFGVLMFASSVFLKKIIRE